MFLGEIFIILMLYFVSSIQRFNYNYLLICTIFYLKQVLAFIKQLPVLAGYRKLLKYEWITCLTGIFIITNLVCNFNAFAALSEISLFAFRFMYFYKKFVSPTSGSRSFVWSRFLQTSGSSGTGTAPSYWTLWSSG